MGGKSRNDRESGRGRSSGRQDEGSLFPTLRKLVREFETAQREFRDLQWRVSDLRSECASLKRQLEQKEEEVSREHIASRVSFFRGMEQNNRLLYKILTFKEGDA